MGLTVYVYRNDLGDCTNGGISADHVRLLVVNIDGPSEPHPETPPVLLLPGPTGIPTLYSAVWDEEADAWVMDPRPYPWSRRLARLVRAGTARDPEPSGACWHVVGGDPVCSRCVARGRGVASVRSPRSARGITIVGRSSDTGASSGTRLAASTVGAGSDRTPVAPRALR